jgi:hypothetical protein
MTPAKEQAKAAVRGIVEQVKQVLSQPEIGPISEADTRANFIDKYVYNLGYDGIGVVVREYYVKDLKEFIDYLLRVDGTTRIAVEAKSLKSDLTDAHAAQLVKYAAIEGIEWCVLTNGREIHIYNQYLKGAVQDKLVLKLDLLAYNSDAEFDVVFDQLWLLSRTSMADAAMMSLMEQVTLDRALRQIVMDPSSSMIKGIRTDLKTRFYLTPKSEQIVTWLKDRIIGRPQLSIVPGIHDEPPAAKADAQDATLRSSSQRTVKDLIDAGLLAAGAQLSGWHRGALYTATVEADGSISLGGKRFSSLSAAGGSITNISTNGWIFWHYRGQPMAAVRAELPNMSKPAEREETEGA